MSKQLLNTTYLFGEGSTFIEDIYNRYLNDPESVDVSWREYFAQQGDKVRPLRASWTPKERVVTPAPAPVLPSATIDASSDSIRANMLIHAYRVRGHMRAKLDPLDMEDIESEQQLSLDPETYGFTEADMDRPIFIGHEIDGVETATLRELQSIMRQIYCGHIGVEFMHIQSMEQKQWIQQKIDGLRNKDYFSAEEKKAILNDIIEVEHFEQFLHIKFPGTKRFSVEGGENSISAVNTVIKTAAAHNVKEVILGMPHRGRLNVLTKVMGKPYASMLSEFQGNLAHPEEMRISGDVKYHLGTSSDKKLDGHTVHLSLTANPSHLEAVNPVVAGKVRAKQDQRHDTERLEVMGILLHGDAAFAGQGLVAETLSLGDLKGYHTGGTIHVVVNNQIGFTTSPKNARASRYPTEFAKIVQAPIFHVNGDDPEAVINVSRIAVEFRQRFKKDAVIDVFCYRLHGHNESDEPSFTQPMMYKKIAAHPTPTEIYSQKLQAEGVITEEEVTAMKRNFRQFLDKELEKSKTYKPNKADWLEGKWSGFEKTIQNKSDKEITGVDSAVLKKIGLKLAEQPKGVVLHPTVIKLQEARRKAIETGEGINWGLAEALAFGSLLTENIPVRLSGQDVGRGTFSHRHSVLIDQNTDERYIPLNHLAAKQAGYEVIDSNLSEFAVLGFDYGYSLAEPNALTIWEGQFGDFANGAQVIIDQFISSSEIKWLRLSGLVMLLPHGYEGQGPEHSSARLERFLQLCAEDNMQVVNCTTPANFFHALRRQIKRNFRKPLIVMSPKSLLRHKLAASALKDMAPNTSFQKVIPEHEKLVADSKIRKVVLCSGKVYYDLFEGREKQGIKDVALVRLEQFYPFPDKVLAAELGKYSNAEIIWCQEEPKNMGGWTFVAPRIEDVLSSLKHKAKRPVYSGRPDAASPAAGYMKVHNKEQADIVAATLL